MRKRRQRKGFPRFWIFLLGIGLVSQGASLNAKMKPADPASTIDRAATSEAAWLVKKGIHGGIVGRGGGLSMAPIFGGNTFIVTAPIAFADLREGMIVAYRNREGVLVVHQLVKRKKGKWLAMGINNPFPDREAVTPENLIGVVYAVFNSAA